MAGLKAEVGRGGVAEEVIGAGDDVAVELDHGREAVGGVGRGFSAQPVETPLEGADDAVGVPGSQGGLPAEHPVGVELREHEPPV